MSDDVNNSGEVDNESIFPSYDEFLEKLFSLSPIGNPEIFYSILKDKLGRMTPTKEVLTFDLLIKRYSDYLAYIKPFNDIKDKQFIKKENVRRQLGEYMMQNMFESDYSAQNNNPNDNYLFGI